MKTSPLVSIITPCYNMEKYIHRLLDSVLNQTYKNIELIVVDDGSKDNSKNIIDEYKAKFEDTGMKLVYIYQKNLGQAEAINKGLVVMTGDYLTWIDSDDYFKITSIENRVNELEKAGEGHFCITAFELVNENDFGKVLRTEKRIKPQGDDMFFMDLIKCKNVKFNSGGGFMIRTSDWIKANPSNYIYPSREGQNRQLMLPIAYNFKCIYIEEPLFIVLEHGDSHSRIKRTLEKNIVRCFEAHKILEQTIMPMKLKNESYYLKISYEQEFLKVLKDCLKEENMQLFKKYSKEYNNRFSVRGYLMIKKLTIKNKLSRNILLRKILGKSPL